MSTRWARFARGWIAALVSTVVAACSHVLGGGTLPGAVGLALALVFSGVICILLAGRTLSVARLSIAVGLSQFAFHGLFSLLTSTAPAGVTTTTTVHAGMEMITRIDGPSSAAVGMPADLQMWAGHLVAAVITVVLLRFGERAFWGLAAIAALTVAAVLASVHVVVSPPPRPSRVAVARALLPQALSEVLSNHRHRGPPALAAL